MAAAAGQGATERIAAPGKLLFCFNINKIMVTTPRAGIAYGVFKCSDHRPMSALIGRFKEALENIKLAHEETKIPPETQFSVFDLRKGMAYVLFVDNATGLAQKVDALEQAGANFVIRSSLPDAPNAIAARDLGDVINMLYGGTELFDAENEGREKRVIGIFSRNDKGEFVSQLEVGLEQRARGE
jgi:hypothetical protein